MTIINTSDGYVFYQLADGTYSDGDVIVSAADIASNGRDSIAWGDTATTTDLWF